MALAHRAAGAGDAAEIADLADLGRALATSAERRLETISQGDAFALAIAKSWPCEGVDHLRRDAPDGVPFPVAVGVAAAGHALDLADTLEAFVLGGVANLVSAAVRLGIVGQTDGQRVTAALLGRVRAVALFAQTADRDDLGGCAFRSDLAAIQHETLYSRLFRS
jgi:urease accessory protein